MHPLRLLTATILAIALMTTPSAANAGEDQQGFATPEAAVQALVAAARSYDEPRLLSIFGPTGKELFFSGDPVVDRQRQEKFVQAYDLKNAVVPEAARRVLTVGEKDWPFPIPLMKLGAQWFFDTAAGKEELLNRWIGENELDTIQTLLAVVDAQREYAMQDRNKDDILEYAERFGSDPGKKNGLYWKTGPGEAPSPLGELVADAWAEGYARKGAKGKPIPFHGYYFRMLECQGQHAPGGAFDYIVRDHLIGGFAVLAYPATYGTSGVMTFLVNHEGVIYEKDLGPKSAKLAPEIDCFDPDQTWKKQ
ncbi:MAG: DUF2950 domain-containing protein [Desulfobacterales bacterium]|nr:DUF2950 domain-containing protein [Desulfobacterales bacterium]